MNQKNLLKGSIIALLCVALIAGIVLSVAQPGKPDDDRLSNVETRPTTGENSTPTDGPDVEPPLGTGPAEPHDPIVPPTVPPVSQPEPKPTEPAPVEPEATEPDSTEPEEPENKVTTLTGNVSSENSTVTEDTFFGDGDISVMVPAGAQLEDNTTSLTLTITEKDSSDSGVQLDAGQTMLPLDVHIEGISAENTAPITISLGTILPKGLNIGNYSLYHVENGVAVKMNAVPTANELSAHNDFVYNPADGNVIISVHSFSEIALVSNEANKWNGEFDDFTGSGTAEDPYIIANADQLAKMSKLVSNYEAYASAHYKLISDVNLNGKKAQTEDLKNLVFYPIGYWKQQDGTNSADETYYGYGNSFSGTFDGNGNTISNIYQNTWLMDGNYDYGYWDAAMGLFGATYNATIKNLIVDGFESDGEFTPTGCIAAYAGGPNMVFENIILTNCNPRVYNTGNGGIVGLNYNSTAGTADNIVFRNITIDQSNKISALWGSYDVACGGIMGRLRENSKHDGTNTDGQKNTVKFENCHVSAIMDVNNDVCANYQYYQYRYCGMFIGTVDYIGDVPAVGLTDVVSAENCTYKIGTWNEYWYCELVANSLASYTHDHQFSRLVKIASVAEIQDENGAWNKAGNFVIPATDNSPATCYHIVKGADGNLVEHTHVMSGYDEGYDVDGDGNTDLKENRQRYLMPFNQLFTGYGWGSSPVFEYDGIKVGNTENSTKKFKVKDTFTTKVYTGDTIAISDIFEQLADTTISASSLNVYLSPVGENSNVKPQHISGQTLAEMSKLEFSGIGAAKITITDYWYCEPTVIKIEVVNREPAVKFNKLFTDKSFTYRVGNTGDVKLSSLFSQADGVDVGTVAVTITNVTGNASGTYTKNSTWSNGTIKFSGTGKVKVTITDDDYCIATELELEVVDATNTTGAANATANNVVLLNDAGFGSLTVSGGYTLYGNGFTLTCGSDSVAADFGYAFVTLENGSLDNVQIVCPNFDHAALYKSNLTSGNRSETDSNGKTRYYNARSGVMVSGNSQILNSRISGGRAAVNVSGGNLLIDNSRIELGAVANILVGAANELTLRDVTLIQKPTASTYDSSKVLMGFSVLYMCDADGDATNTKLEGSFVQQAWVDESHTKYVPSGGDTIISEVLEQDAFLHDYNNDGVKDLNLGFAYMPENITGAVAVPNNITDSRTNKDSIPYDMATISYSGTKLYVFSYSNNMGTDTSFIEEIAYTPNKYGNIITASYADTTDGLASGKTFTEDGWVYELGVDLDKLPGYALDFNKLSMSINGIPVTSYQVNGSAAPSTVTVTTGGVTYTLTATVDGTTYTTYFKVTGTEASKESPSLVASNYVAGICVAESYGGKWHGAAPALEGIQIKYWSVAEKQYKTINLSDYTPTSKGKQNGTNNTWTYSPANGDFTLTLTGGQVHSSNQVNAMPVVCDGKLYFVASSTNGLVNPGNSARTIPVTYTFKDNNNGDVLTFSHTWSVAENKDAQYKYSDFCSGKMTKLENCITGDTLVTLADGTQVRVDQLTGDEMLLVWNLETGRYDFAPIVFVDQDAETEVEIITLTFSDGSEVKVIYEHGFFDYDLGKYVYLDAENAESYIGHRFLTQGDISGNTWNTATLTGVTKETKVAAAYSPVTFSHLCYYVDGVLSMPGGIEGLFNIFDVDTDTMSYDTEKKAQDIEKYGLYTFEDFAGLIPEEAYYAFNGAYLKVAIGKGLLTWEDIARLAERYVPLM